MSDYTSELIRVADKNDATRGLISEKNALTLEYLTRHMQETNKELNLTAICDDDGIILKHLVDSSAIIPFITDNAKIVDIGCGGGFPSLVIATLKPDATILAVDSVTKKVNYVKSTAELLGLDNISVSNERAEAMGQGALRQTFDIACARAVGRLNLICELCLPLVKVGGCFLAMKSLATREELREAEKAITTLGGKTERVFSYTLTNGKEEIERSIIVIRKVSQTPTKYPRNNSQISKKPL